MRAITPLLGILAVLPVAAAQASPHDGAWFPPVGTLPLGAAGPAAVWTGQTMLVFGGIERGSCGGAVCGATSKSIHLVDPRTREVTQAAQLPIPLAYPAAVWTGTEAYVFGGANALGVPQDSIVRYDPTTASTSIMNARLPRPTSHLAAVWDGESAYLFGSVAGDAGLRITRYDPRADAIDEITQAPPGPLTALAATTDGARVYLFGGIAPPGTRSRDRNHDGITPDGERGDQILRFDLATRTIDGIGRLPSPFSHAAAAWINGSAYVFGGNDGRSRHQIVHFDPATNEAREMRMWFAGGRSSPAAVSTRSNVAYVIGSEMDGMYVEDVVSFDPAREPPPQRPTPPAPGVAIGALALVALALRRRLPATPRDPPTSG